MMRANCFVVRSALLRARTSSVESIRTVSSGEGGGSGDTGGGDSIYSSE